MTPIFLIFNYSFMFFIFFYIVFKFFITYIFISSNFSICHNQNVPIKKITDNKVALIYQQTQPFAKGLLQKEKKLNLPRN